MEDNCKISSNSFVSIKNSVDKENKKIELDNLLNDFFPIENHNFDMINQKDVNAKIDEDQKEINTIDFQVERKFKFCNEIIKILSKVTNSTKKFHLIFEKLFELKFNSMKLTNSLILLNYINKNEDEEFINTISSHNIELENNFSNFEIINKFFSKILKENIDIDPTKNLENELFLIQIISYFLQNKLYDTSLIDNIFSFQVQFACLKYNRSSKLKIKYVLKDNLIKEIYRYLFKGNELSLIELEDLKLCEGEFDSKTKFFLLNISHSLLFYQNDMIKDIKIKNLNIKHLFTGREFKDKKEIELIEFFGPISPREMMLLIASNHYPNKEFPDLYLTRYIGPILMQLGFVDRVHKKYDEYKGVIKSFQENLGKIIGFDLSDEYCEFKSITKKSIYNSLKLIANCFRTITSY